MLGLILVPALMQRVSGQQMIYAHPTNIDVTSYVVADKPLTVTVTVSYSYLTISEESLLISILDRAKNGNPIPTTSTDPSCASERLHLSRSNPQHTARPPSAMSVHGIIHANHTNHSRDMESLRLRADSRPELLHWRVCCLVF